MFILGRAVAGPGSAGLQNGAFKVIRHKFDLLGNHGLARSRILRQYIPVELGHCHGPAGRRRSYAWCLRVPGEAGRRQCHDAADHYSQAGTLDCVPDHGVPVYCFVRSELLPADLLPEHTGHYPPFAAASAVIVTIGSGLLATFDPFTPTAQWVGYEVFVGAGRGLGIQIAAIAILASTPARLVGMATATMVFCQTFSAWGIGWKGIRRKKDLIEGRET
ncbi:hypothetical protein MGU_07185 [Metarhizium guizhouense ARSEF 977]|uniref:Uncharacterized protein n=1 Tax=Metarhizium guizhouense (strain ARSEF 977) TaxID=1276136 RepID=A0A0B4GSM4_METGA|nr:hypothetical protein MGU_07185 [Metarhizium guizhouense ARSEF 977]